jgi:hypothetical protein
MNRELSGLAYDEAAALYPGLAYEGGLDYPVELQLVDDKQADDLPLDDEIREMKKAEIEAYTAARIIRETKGKLIFDAKREKKDRSPIRISSYCSAAPKGMRKSTMTP